ncbi:MAG: hypothetical protein EPN22_11755 [Nitrospirae bacterium]|nr:MAG: hypothetical protein EPN22_11755 [Nitrospirota bacterium]
MSIEKAFHAIEEAMGHCSALRMELNEKVSAYDKGALYMRSFEMIDLLERALVRAGEEMNSVSKG